MKKGGRKNNQGKGSLLLMSNKTRLFYVIFCVLNAFMSPIFIFLATLLPPALLGYDSLSSTSICFLQYK